MDIIEARDILHSPESTEMQVWSAKIMMLAEDIADCVWDLAYHKGGDDEIRAGYALQNARLALAAHVDAMPQSGQA